MDALTFAQKLISSLVWPALVVAVVLLFRHQIAQRIVDLKKVKGPGFEAEFELIGALGDAVDRRAIPSAGAQAADEAIAKEAEVVELLADEQPRAAILASWILVEKEARDAAERLGLTFGTAIPRSPSVQWLLSLLAQEGVLSDEAIELAQRLHRIRNAAVHDLSFVPTQEQATEFSEAARSLARLLRTARRGDSSQSD